MKEIKEGIIWAACIIGAALILIEWHSPYNQCVRAQSYLNQNNRQWAYTYPKTQARVQCAEAIGGKPD